MPDDSSCAPLALIVREAERREALVWLCLVRGGNETPKQSELEIGGTQRACMRACD